MNERFWTNRDWDYSSREERDDRYQGRQYDDRGRRENYYREEYGEPDHSFYYGGFRSREHMGPIFGGENFGTSGYGHSGQMHGQDRPYSDNEHYRSHNYEREGRQPRYYEDERFGESHQHRYHARTSDMWDRPAAYNMGGYGSAELGREEYEYPGEYREKRNYYDRGYRGQGYEDIHRWRGW